MPCPFASFHALCKFASRDNICTGLAYLALIYLGASFWYWFTKTLSRKMGTVFLGRLRGYPESVLGGTGAKGGKKTGGIGTPFQDSLTAKQKKIQEESCKIRGKMFKEGIILAVLVLALTKPFAFNLQTSE